ncbi:PadR family transcriptional regulator [Sphingomonas jinjuensis]|nr:PadR family transcriptional regulator [Sphingomonas jinjuensis]
MFGHRHCNEGRYRDARARGFAPRGGWEQWNERLEHRFAEMFGEGRGGGGGGRSRRMFDGGELRLVLLKLIGDQPLAGYELIKAIEAFTNGAYAPSPGVVYPTLTLLDELGQIEQQESEGARKRYAITEVGRQHLAENAEAVAALIARLQALGEHRARSDRAPIRRAMHNLRAVLQNKLEAGALSDEAAHDVADLLDEVARKIERLK